MKRKFIYSKKSVRTLLLKLEPYFLSHAERGESLQNQDFVGGIQNRRRFAPTPFRLPIPIFNFGGGGEIRTREALPGLVVFKTTALDQLCDPSAPRGIAICTSLCSNKSGTRLVHSS